MMRAIGLALGVGVWAVAAVAGAQPPAVGPQRWVEARVGDGGGARLVTEWQALQRGTRQGTVSLDRLGADMRTRVGGTVAVARGTAAITALAVREQTAAVVLAERGSAPRVRVAILDLPQGRDGRPAAPRLRRTLTANRDRS